MSFIIFLISSITIIIPFILLGTPVAALRALAYIIAQSRQKERVSSRSNIDDSGRHMHHFLRIFWAWFQASPASFLMSFLTKYMFKHIFKKYFKTWYIFNILKIILSLFQYYLKIKFIWLLMIFYIFYIFQFSLFLAFGADLRYVRAGKSMHACKVGQVRATTSDPITVFEVDPHP